jgi:SNF2 family DNA or RNA helicase
MVSRGSLEPIIKDDVAYYDHQVRGVRQLAKMTSFLLADEMGLGKSLQAITVFAIDAFRGWASAAIVVCPPTLKGNWADELDKFTRINYIVLDGTPTKRAEQIVEFASLLPPKILITNYEQVVKHVGEFNALGFDACIFDEAHYIKNPKSQRTKAAHELSARRNFLLTGTPMLNHANDLWSLLHKIDPSAYPRYWGFVNRFCVFGGFKDKQIVGTKNEKELRKRLQTIMVRRLKKDVLDLPEVQIIQRRVDLSPEQKKIYDTIKDDMRVVRPGDAPDEEVSNALAMFTRLKQVCGTSLSFNGKDISTKLDLAIEDDCELFEADKKIVVFTQFREVQDCYIKRLTAVDASIPIFQLNGDVKIPDRQPIVHEWSRVSGHGVIVCMLQVAGVGLNMVAAQHGSFLDKLFVPGLNKQAIDRLHRIGQNTTQPVQIREYITRKTIENRVEQILKTKDKIFGEIVEIDPSWKKKLLEALLEGDDDD